MSRMFQFHTRVVSGTLGRMPRYSFLFQTQCEVFNFNTLCNYNGYRAYTALIHAHPLLVLGRWLRGTEGGVALTYHTHFKTWKRAQAEGRGERGNLEPATRGPWPGRLCSMSLVSKFK